MTSSARWLGLVAVSLATALAAACFDTRLIPSTPPAEGGAPDGGAGAGSAGRNPSEAGGDEGGSGPGASGAAAAGTAPGGSAGKPSGGAPNGGAPHGGAPNGVTWLSLQGSEAPASEEPNGALGISGHFYAYRDDCAELHWDEATRCATGQLCDSLGGLNWGVAVGFDFKNTPAGAKLTWDPRDVGALGVAFEIGGEAQAPGLQLWVLNMDDSWEGECTAMTCEIAGPPDGRRALPLKAELWFDSMQKDDWGGGGLYYTYDPAAVFALQFKLPAIEVGATSFSFCVDALGILR